VEPCFGANPDRVRIAPIGSPVPEPVSQRRTLFQKQEEDIVGFLLAKYGGTDWSVPLGSVLANPAEVGNPNVAVIPLALAGARLFRWRLERDPADLASAVEWTAWVAEHHDAWGQRWLSPAVVFYLELTSRMVLSDSAGSASEPRAIAVRSLALEILAEEADARLTDAYPFLPLDSSGGGDSKAEEDAWEAGLLAAAANDLPDAAHAGDWDRKARQLAYDSITLAADPPDLAGVKTTTVRDNFDLPNHGFVPNEYYTASTLNLLRTGALFYEMAGLAVPEEFSHHVADLFAAYRTHVDVEYRWTAPCDEGDATLFPLPVNGGADLEREVVAAKWKAGYLWRPGGPVASMGTGVDLWEAIQDSKTVEQYLGSYVWHFGP
jgi:hypothetical protein